MKHAGLVLNATGILCLLLSIFPFGWVGLLLIIAGFGTSLITRKQTTKKETRVSMAINGLAWLYLFGSLGLSMVVSANTSAKENKFVVVDEESSAKEACKSLDNLYAARIYFGFSKLKKGGYTIKPGIKWARAYWNMTRGNQAPIKVTVPDTRTMEEWAGRVTKDLEMDSLTLYKKLQDKAFCKKYGYTPQTIMAMIIPNSYQMYWGMTPEQFMDKLQKEYEKFWSGKRDKQAKEMGLSRLEVSTLASIVEEEALDKSEEPMIAEMYLNRLEQNMRLEADPTVKMAVGDWTLRRILKKHLEVDSPYNTYRHKGLPPGPIRIPTIRSIDAVLNHADHDYLFMCAKEDFSGRHNFSKTFEEHKAHAEDYRKALNQRGIK